MADSASVDIDGRVVRLTNLTKVLYPEVGFTKGDVIGYVGNTGHSFGDHLHFEVRIDGAAVDPMGYL